MSSPVLKKFTSAGVPPERLHGVQSAARATSASSSPEQQLLGLQGKAGNQAVQIVLDEAGLEHAIRNLPRLPSGNAVPVLRRYLAYIENRIISGEGRIQAQMALRAESFGNYLIGDAIEVFGGTSLPSDDWRDAWNLINRGRDEIQRGQIKEALETLVSASKATTARWESLNDYLESTDKGVDRSVFTLQILQAAGALAATALTGGGATAVVVGAGYGATQNLAGQATSVAIGIQSKIDWSGMAFDTLFGLLTGAAGGRLGNAVLKKLMGRPEVASLGRRVISEIVSDLASGRLSSILHTVGRGLFDKFRGKEQLTVDQFIERLADQLMDPKGMFMDALMGRAAKIAHAKKSPTPIQGETKIARNDQQTNQKSKFKADLKGATGSDSISTTPIKKVTTPEKKARVTEDQSKVSRKTMARAGEPPVKTTTSRTKQPKAVEQLQEKLNQEAKHRLAPRKAPETPAEVKGGLREPRYRAPKEGSNTVGKPTKSLEQARRLYDDVIAESSGKHEVGIWQKGDGTYVVRIGQMTEVDAPRDWRPVQHFHTNAPDIPLWRMPARADVAETSVRAAGTGHPVTELVEYPLPDGKRGRAAYTVNPDNSVKIEFVDPTGQRVVKEFPSVKDYNDYHDTHKVHVEPGSESYKSLMKDLDKTFGRTPSPEAADTVTKTMAGPAPKKQKLTSKGNKKGPGPSSAPQKIDKSSPATKASPSRKKPVMASPPASRTSTEWLTKRGTPEYRALGMKVLRGRFSETPAMKRLWKRASQGCQQSDAGYDIARERFWKLVATSTDDDARLIRTILKDAGYETPMGRAANIKMTWATELDPKRLAKLEKTRPDVVARLRISAEEARRERTPEGLQAQQRKESIEHAIPRHPAPGSAMEKKAAKYPNRFLDPANLRLENLYENMLMGNKPSAN